MTRTRHYDENAMMQLTNLVDLFDLICHVAYDQPPLTRKRRANNVKENATISLNMANKPGK
ncbi:MAG: type I restriction-modification enzyme R subunit C-terminal domain-containing protein [Flavobacteriaceae bacterium]